MYLREMGTVPLLTREGEVAIAKRIEVGKLAVIKSISRTPKVTQEVVEMGEGLRRGERTVRELVVFNEEEITDEKILARQREVLKQIDRVKAAVENLHKLQEKYGEVQKSTSASTAAPSGARAARRSSSRAPSGASSSPRWSSAA
jgi:RNA polymerase primary sigma factor